MTFENETIQAGSERLDRPLIEPWSLCNLTSVVRTWVGETRLQTTLLKQLVEGTQSLTSAARNVNAVLPDASGPAFATSQAAIAALAASHVSLSAAAASRDQALAALAEAQASAELALRQGDDVLLARRMIAILVAFAFCLLVYVTLHG